MSDNPSAPGNKSDTFLPPPNEPRLESWGEIASYLRRDIRTVQRWEKEQGLPVRRLQIGKQGQVYAYRSELDRWVLERQPKAAAEEPPEPKPQPPAPDSLPDDSEYHGPFSFATVWKPALVGLLLLAGGTFLLYRLLAPKPRNLNTIRTPARVLLFVRPFANLSPSPSEKEFVEGLTDEMITQLGRVDPGSMGVFAPTTSKELAVKTIPELKQSLKADFVLEGSVRRADEQIRIDIDLISTGDQTPTWTNSYTGNLQRVLAFQDEVVADVVRHIFLTLPPSKIANLQRPPSGQTTIPTGSSAASSDSSSGVSVDPQVYEAYVIGREHLLLRDFPSSMDAFERAIQRNSQYAPALAGLATSQMLLGEAPNDVFRPSDAMPKARTLAYEALHQNPNLSDAYGVLANIAQGFEHDLPEAERLYKKAIALDPSNVNVLKWYSDYLFVTSRINEASQQIEKALEIDPASPLLNTAKAEAKYYQRDFDGAIAQAQLTLDRHPDFLLAHFWLASAYRQKRMFPQALQEFEVLHKRYPSNSALLMAYGHALGISGDKTGAQNALNELQAQAQSRYVPAVYFAGLCTALGDLNQTFQWLDKAYAEKNDRLVYLGVDPIADPLRPDPRFSKLMKKVGLR